MEKIELIMLDHPPHSPTYKKMGLSLRCMLIKVVLFSAIFIIVFHLPHFTPIIRYLPTGTRVFIEGLANKEETIQEIRKVLEKYPTGLANVTKEELAEVIYEEATRYNHDPKFIMALIAIESSFQNWSVSERGAKGLMQIMPCVAESLAREMGIEWSGDRTLFNPFLNIRMGIYYLSRLTLDFNDMGIALTAYNCGPTYVKSLIEKRERIPLQYYRKILTVYQNL
jgi:soluble lytic murein transglycosylase-like protein